MKPKYAWGRMRETRLGQPKDVFRRNQAGYPMWTEAMKAAIGPLRQAGRKWYSLYIVRRRSTLAFSLPGTDLWRAGCGKTACPVR